MCNLDQIPLNLSNFYLMIQSIDICEMLSRILR